MKLARIDPATGRIQEFPLTGLRGILGDLLDGGSIGNPLPIPGPIVTGSDGKLYFSLNIAGRRRTAAQCRPKRCSKGSMSVVNSSRRISLAKNNPPSRRLTPKQKPP